MHSKEAMLEKEEPFKLKLNWTVSVWYNVLQAPEIPIRLMNS